MNPEECEALLIVAGLASYTRFGVQIKATASLLSLYLSSSSHCATHSSSCCVGWLLCCLLMQCPLVVSSSSRAASRCLIAPAGCHIIISRSPLIAPPFCPLIVLGTTMARGSRTMGGTMKATGSTTTGGMRTARGSRATCGTTTAMGSKMKATAMASWDRLKRSGRRHCR